MTSDNRSIKVNGSDIERVEKGKDTEYQLSGPTGNKGDSLSIKDTPFNLDQDK